MADNAANNKRIAKNTLMLYVRMLFAMIVSLYTSRVILATLGITDYGINNVVGGVVSMFGFLNASMSTSTQRYLTYELGKGDKVQLAKVFSLSVLIHIIIAIVVLVLAETVGLWFVNNKLVIPEGRMTAANWVYQFSIIGCILTIIQVPYNASIISHEKMNVFALIGIFEVVAKLLLVWLLVILPFDKLIACSFMFLLVSIIVRIIYQVYCRKNFEECHFRRQTDKTLFKGMFSFAGWNIFGSLAWLLRDQGVNIILNMFFGPALNAARGVALQISGAVNGFVGNFNTAVNPQITKNYATGELHEMEILTYRASKFAFLLLFFISFPLLLNIDFVMQLWLKDVPEYASTFAILILIDSFIHSVFGSPFITSLMATGKIRTYQIVVGSTILLIVPLGYVALRLGYPATSVLIISIIITFLSGVMRYAFCVKQIGFRWRLFIRRTILPISLVCALSIPLPIVLAKFINFNSDWSRFLITCTAAVACNGIASFYIGMNCNERKVIVKKIQTVLTKK